VCVSSTLSLVLLGEAGDFVFRGTGVAALEGAGGTAGAKRSGVFVVDRRIGGVPMYEAACSERGAAAKVCQQGKQGLSLSVPSEEFAEATLPCAFGPSCAFDFSRRSSLHLAHLFIRLPAITVLYALNRGRVCQKCLKGCWCCN
jgi:hypothetical protein